MIQKWLTLMMLQKKKKRPKTTWSKLALNSWSSYRILIIGVSGSGKINSLFNLINQQPNIDKINVYAKNPYEAR